MKPKVFIPEPIAPCGIDLLQDDCDLVAPWQDGTELPSETSRGLLYTADATIVRLFGITEPDLRQCQNLKEIGRHGVGVDSVDCRAAAARGIVVVYTPAATTNAVAEHALALIMALAKQIVPAWQAVVDGRFNERTRFQSVELAGKTLGVIGLGRIGSRVAIMAAQGLAMNVVAYDPVVTCDQYDGPATMEPSLESALGKSDFLTLHVPLSPKTYHLISDERLGMCKPGCRIINTSRGAVIDEAALMRALENGTVAGAALDVFESEPLPADHPLCRAPNTLLTPHISSSTPETLDNVARDVAQGVLDVLQGRQPQYAVNAEALP